MTKNEFLQKLTRGLTGLPQDQIDEIAADYAAHFEEAQAAGRADEDTAQALGNPGWLAREHICDTYYQEYYHHRRPLDALKWLLASNGLARLAPSAKPLAIIVPVVICALMLVFGAIIGWAVVAIGLGAAVAAVVFSVIFRAKPRHARGASDEVVEKVFGWSPSDRVIIGLPAEIHWKPSETARAVVSAKPWLLEHIRINGPHIRGRFKWRLFQDNYIRIDLEGPAVAHWDLLGSGDLHLHDVAQPVLSLRVAGSGDIIATGRADEVLVQIEGTGDVNVGGVEQARTKVEMTGNGDATIAPDEAANLSIAGAGDIILMHMPSSLITSITGRGDIKLMDGTPVR